MAEWSVTSPGTVLAPNSRSFAADVSERATAVTSSPPSTTRRTTPAPTTPEPPVTATLMRPSSCRLRLAHDVPEGGEIVPEGGDGDHDRHGHRPLVEIPGTPPVGKPQVGEEDGDELEGGLDLAPGGGTDEAAAGRHDAPQRHHRELPEDDHERRPDRHPVDRHQCQQRPGDEHLVGGGVQEGAEHGLLLPASGEVAVEEVGEGGDGEDGGRPAQVVGDLVPRACQRHDHGHYENPCQSEKIGNRDRCLLWRATTRRS